MDGAPGRSVGPASARGPIPIPVAELAAELAGGQGAAGLVGLNRPEPPANAYITRDGLDWAWAAPVPAGLTALDLSGPGGWRVPSPAELLSAPRAGDFVFPGANVPLGGEDPASGAAFLMPGPGLTAAAACAAPYFGTEYRHCDWVDGDGVFALPWAGKAGESPFSEQLLVRDARPREMQVAGGGAARVGADAE
ncbi:MAG: PEP-CTERM sorting domain-containing protein [Pseudomonadota bacterium]|nr:PEP-CTERM sorting domain-containing protein [Pseudomonadota bacterium]MEE3098453.1 PEP-CTERM sorting domain-containing protein [Pseudomonadota bacterium]